jgi:hypothetical protein
MRHLRRLAALVLLSIATLPTAARAADALYDEGGNEEERFSLRFTGGLLLDSHSTNSADPTKFTVSLPSSTGWVAGGELRYHKREAVTSWRLRYRHYDTTYASLGSSLTPSSVSDRREEFHLGLYVVPFNESKFFQHLKLGLGAMVFLRSVDETRPNAVLTSSLTNALTLNASYGRRVNDDVSWEANLSLGLPVGFREFYQRTGNFVGAVIGRAGLSVAYTISRFVDLALAPEARWDRFVFEDNGARGTQGATDGGLSISIPLEIRVRF